MCARDVLLIDEMSLITPNMLADIDRALKKATRCEHDFGNWLVILSGDEAEIEAGSDEDVSVHVVSCLLLLDLSSLANAGRAC